MVHSDRFVDLGTAKLDKVLHTLSRAIRKTKQNTPKPKQNRNAYFKTTSFSKKYPWPTGCIAGLLADQGLQFFGGSKVRVALSF